MQIKLGVEDGSITITGKKISIEVDSDSTARVTEAQAKLNDSITRAKSQQVFSDAMGNIGKSLAIVAAKTGEKHEEHKPTRAARPNRNATASKRTGGAGGNKKK